MPQVETRLETSGMHCSSCAMLIDMTVGELPGVASVKTDHALGETVVSYDSEVVSLETIVGAISAAGYEATPAD